MKYPYLKSFLPTEWGIKNALPPIEIPADFTGIVVRVPYAPAGVITDMTVEASDAGSAFTVDLLDSKKPFDPDLPFDEDHDASIAGKYDARLFSDDDAATAAYTITHFQIAPTATAASGVATITHAEYPYRNRDAGFVNSNRCVYLVIIGADDEYNVTIRSYTTTADS